MRCDSNIASYGNHQQRNKARCQLFLLLHVKWSMTFNSQPFCGELSKPCMFGLSLFGSLLSFYVLINASEKNNFSQIVWCCRQYIVNHNFPHHTELQKHIFIKKISLDYFVQMGRKKRVCHKLIKKVNNAAKEIKKPGNMLSLNNTNCQSTATDEWDDEEALSPTPSTRVY